MIATTLNHLELEVFAQINWTRWGRIQMNIISSTEYAVGTWMFSCMEIIHDIGARTYTEVSPRSSVIINNNSYVLIDLISYSRMFDSVTVIVILTRSQSARSWQNDTLFRLKGFTYHLPSKRRWCRLENMYCTMTQPLDSHSV